MNSETPTSTVRRRRPWPRDAEEGPFGGREWSAPARSLRETRTAPTQAMPARRGG